MDAILGFWKWLDGKKAAIGVVATVILSILHRRGVEVPPWVFDVTDGILGLGLAHRAVKVAGAKVVAAACAVFCLASCAAPNSDQGQGQGGSTGAAPLVVINVGTGGGVEVTNTSFPTAAPSAESAAKSHQAATNDVKPTVAAGDKAIEAVSPVPSLVDGVLTVKPLPEPKPEVK